MSKYWKRPHTIFLVIFFASVIGLRLWGGNPKEATVELRGAPLRVLVAASPKHQYTGLGGRDSLEPYDGMLFVFSFPRYVGIVMRDMRFPIDIVWFDQGKVVDIAPRVPIEPDVKEEDLRVYQPRLPASHVLELPAGWAEEHGLKIGDELRVVGE